MYDDVLYKGRFIWNRLKNVLNQKNHKISFENAVEVFEDPFCIEEYDEANSDYEDRYNITGYLKDWHYITVSFTMRDNLVRILSAREADGEEEGAYDKNVGNYFGRR
jgi:uncharacterized DUF497 family protein